MIETFYCRADLTPDDSWGHCKSINNFDYRTFDCSVPTAVHTPDSVLVPGNLEPEMMRDLPCAGHGKPKSYLVGCGCACANRPQHQPFHQGSRMLECTASSVE